MAFSSPIACSVVARDTSSQVASYLRLESIAYGSNGNTYLNTLADMSEYLSQGNYLVNLLYSYRSCSNAIPMSPGTDNASGKQEYNKKLFVLLRAEVVKMVDFMNFCKDLTDHICRSVLKYNEYQECGRVYPQELLDTFMKMLDLMIKLDALKDLKVCLKNDFALYKRALHVLKSSLQETDQLEKEVHRVQMFLSHPAHSKGYVMAMLKDKLQGVKGGHSAMLTRVIEACFRESTNSSQKQNCQFSHSKRYRPHRILPHIFWLVDELGIEGSSSATNVFKTKSFMFDKCISVFKRYPVVPLMFEMYMNVVNVLRKCPNYDARSLGKALKVSASVKASYILVGKKVQSIVRNQSATLKQLEDICSKLQPLKFDNAPGETVLSESTPDLTSKDCALAYAASRDALMALSNGAASVVTQASWKYANPVGIATRKNSSAQQQNVNDYARCVLHNYNAEEKDGLIETISSSKCLAHALQQQSYCLQPAIRQFVYETLQTFAHETLQTMLRKAYKSNKKETVAQCLMLQRIVTEWVNGKEPYDMFTLRRKERNKRAGVYKWTPKQAGASLPQLLLIKVLLGNILDDSSEAMVKSEGFFKSRVFTAAVISKIESMYQAVGEFYHMLSIRDTTKNLCNFSCLWFREFYLEISKQTQFPIALSLPWILTEHIIFKPGTPNMDKIFHVLDVYNDVGSLSLQELGQQFFYDEVEAEVNLVFDQLLFMINRHLYGYFKNIAASLQIKTELLAALEAKHKRVLTPQKNETYFTIINTRKVMLLGRQLDLHKILAHTLENEFYRDVEKCFGTLEKHDLCNIIQFDALLRVLEQTHKVISEYFPILPYQQIIHTINESVSLRRQPGRLAAFVSSDIHANVLPNMVYYNSRSSCLVYNRIAGATKQKYLRGLRKKSNARKSHLHFGSAYHEFFETGYKFRELHLSQSHVRTMFKVLRPYGLKLVLGDLLDNLENHMENKICPYLKALLPGVKPVILPNFQMLTNINYLAVEATVKGFFKFSDVTGEVLKALQELGNLIGLLRMFDMALENEADNDDIRMVVPELKRKKKKKAKHNEPLYDAFAKAETVSPPPNDSTKKDDDSEQKEVPFIPESDSSFLKKGLKIVHNVLNRDMSSESFEGFQHKTLFSDRLPRLFGSLFFIFCRPSSYIIGKEKRTGTQILYDHHGEGLFLGSCALICGLGILDSFRDKSYNSHILKVNLFEKTQEKTPQQIGIVDAETKAEIDQYIETAEVVEDVVEHFLQQLSKFNPNKNITIPTVLQQQVSEVKSVRESVMFRRISSTDDLFEETAGGGVIDIGTIQEEPEDSAVGLKDNGNPLPKTEKPKPALSVETARPAPTPPAPPKYEKFRKMLRMGVPEEAVRAKLLREGLDPNGLFASPEAPKPVAKAKMPTVLQETERSKPTPKVETTKLARQVEATTPALKADAGPKYEKFQKMLRMGVPEGAVRVKLLREGLDPNVLFASPEAPTPVAKAKKPTVLREIKKSKPARKVEPTEPAPKMDTGPKYEKFQKMLRMGVPEVAVRAKLLQEGLDPNVLLPSEDGGKGEARKPIAKTDVAPQYKKFQKMLRMGVPEGAVRAKLLQEGLNPNVLFASEDGGNAEAPKPVDESTDANVEAENSSFLCLGYVLYSFDAAGETDDELSLAEGDYIEISATHEDDWWEGTVRGTTRSGVFPMNHVSLVLKFKGREYLMYTDTKEVYEMSNPEVCLGVYDEVGKKIRDEEGNFVADWSEAVLL
jgi:cytoplasmic FMR1 interacting protein